jgi:hypothetical protein
MFPLLGSRFLIMQQLDYSDGGAVFYVWSLPRCYNREVWSLVSNHLIVSSVRESVKGRLGPTVEESPLLEAVAREWLVKTQWAGKGFAGAVVISELWRLAVAL